MGYFLHSVFITKQIIRKCLKKKKIEAFIHNLFSLFCSCCKLAEKLYSRQNKEFLFSPFTFLR